MCDSGRAQPTASTIIRSLSSLDGIDDNLSEDGTIHNSVTETVDIYTQDTVTVTESIGEEVFPQSEYRKAVSNRASLSDRYAKAPTSHRNETVEFVERGKSPETCTRCSGGGRHGCPTCGTSGAVTCSNCDGNTQVSCSNCRSGWDTCSNCSGSGTIYRQTQKPCSECGGAATIPCPNCGGTDADCHKCHGDGTVQCSWCHGSGTVDDDVQEACGTCNGNGEVRCTNCNGSGSVPCSTCGATGQVTCRNCDGGGSVVCERCSGDGEVVEATSGTLRFRANREASIEADRIPERYLEESDGELESSYQAERANRPSWGGTGVFHEWKRHYSVPCHFVEYGYKGETYEVVYVGGDVEDLRFTDYPTNPESVMEAAREAILDIPAAADSLTANYELLLHDAKTWLYTLVVMFVGVVAMIVLIMLGDHFNPGFNSDTVILIGNVAVGGLVGIHSLRRWQTAFPDEGDLVSDNPRSLDRAGWNYNGKLAYPTGAFVVPVLVGGATAALWITNAVRLEVLLPIAGAAAGLFAIRVTSLLQMRAFRSELRSGTRERIFEKMGIDEAYLEKHGLQSEFFHVNDVLDGAWLKRIASAVYLLSFCGSTLLMFYFLSYFALDPPVSPWPMIRALGATVAVAGVALVPVALDKKFQL